MAKYAIVAKKGYWGSVERCEDSLVARVDNAASASQALEIFRGSSVARREFENEFQAVTFSALTSSQKEWILNYVEEIHDAAEIVPKCV